MGAVRLTIGAGTSDHLAIRSVDARLGIAAGPPLSLIQLHLMVGAVTASRAWPESTSISKKAPHTKSVIETVPSLSRINYYPFKSLDGQSVTSARVLASGALEHDRRFAIFDAAGKVINGKRTAAVHRLRCEFDALSRYVALRRCPAGETLRFHVDDQRTELMRWLGEYFGMPDGIQIKEDPLAGFPDDRDAPGPTVISEATLEAVAGWFEGLTVDEVRSRFRPNLEIGGVPAFWEDGLYAGADELVEFAVGGAMFAGTNPCRRCVVPSRWSLTGEVGPDEAFAKTFALQRERNLPPWANVTRFDHYYRLAVNTRPASAGESFIRVGDEVHVLGTRPR